MNMCVQYLLLSVIVVSGVLASTSGLQIPLFITPLKELPQPLNKTSSFYSSDNRVAFFSKVTTWDVWKATNHSVSELYNSSVYDIISIANYLYKKSLLRVSQLKVHQCGQYCYVMKLSDIEYHTSYTRSELTGQSDPPITFGALHEAVVKTLQDHFCFTMSSIEQKLGISSFNVTLPEWKLFLPEIAWSAIQCRADVLVVGRSEFAELLRTKEATLLNYTLSQLDSMLISPYLRISSSKSVFLHDEISEHIEDHLEDNWRGNPLYKYIYSATNFTIRDLEILSDASWNSTQKYALQSVPLRSYSSCTGAVSLNRTMYDITKSILEDFNCSIVLVLSTSVGHVQTFSSDISGVLELSVLGIFTRITGMESWEEIADILEVKSTNGIIIDTPRLREIADNEGVIQDTIFNSSVPQIIAKYISLKKSSYIYAHYTPMFDDILSTYAFSPKELFEASQHSLTGGTTITELHQWLLQTIMFRYDVSKVSLIGNTEYFPSNVDLVTLPSFEWPHIIDGVIQLSIKQAMTALSYDLQTHPGVFSIFTQRDNFQTITVSKQISFNDDTIADIGKCLFNKTIDSIDSDHFKVYHKFYNNTIAPTMMKKIIFETESLASLLSKWDYDLQDLDNTSLWYSVYAATGFELYEIDCLYNDSTSSLLRSGITWDDIWNTKLCFSFTSYTLLQIVKAVDAASTVNCDSGCSSNLCHANGNCSEDDGSGYACTCKDGFTGDGYTSCADINECGTPSTCHSDATCQNTIGSYACTCEPGFTGDGKTDCKDINECTNLLACHSDATCQNTIGSYACTCKPGFIGDGKTECKGSSNPPSSSGSNIDTGVVVGAVVGGVVVIVAVILIVACFLYRRNPARPKSRDVGHIQNAAYVGDVGNRRLPQVPQSNSGYEEPSQYAQLDSSRRVPMDANYQSLRHKNQHGGSSDTVDKMHYHELERDNGYDQRYTSVNTDPAYDAAVAQSYVTIVDKPGKEIPKESIYEELP